MSLSRFLLMVCTLSSLTGCTQSFEIKTERVYNGIEFRFTRKYFIVAVKYEPCLTSFEVRDGGRVGKVRWRIESIKPGVCVKLDALRYGSVPKGMREIIKGEPVLRDKMYDVDALAEPNIHGSLVNIHI